MVLFRQLTAKFAPFGARVSNRALSLQRVHPRGGPQPLNFHAHTRALFTRQKNVCEYCDKPRKPNCRYAYSQQLQGTLDPPEHQAPPETQAPGEELQREPFKRDFVFLFLICPFVNNFWEKWLEKF